MTTAADIQRELEAIADPKRAESNRSFFKTGKGQYAEGDRFIGLAVPQLRATLRRYRGIALVEVLSLLKSPVHEHRFLALLFLVDIYQKAHIKPKVQEKIVRSYLKHLRYVDNWDLVDTSSPKIWGNWLLSRDRSQLYVQIRSKRLWTRRVAMIATQELIKHGEAKDALRLAELLLCDREDLMHKAAGWMLREVGLKVGVVPLRSFLKAHATKMPRTMLRYAIEKLPAGERKRWLTFGRA